MIDNYAFTFMLIISYSKTIKFGVSCCPTLVHLIEIINAVSIVQFSFLDLCSARSNIVVQQLEFQT